MLLRIYLTREHCKEDPVFAQLLRLSLDQFSQVRVGLDENANSFVKKKESKLF